MTRLRRSVRFGVGVGGFGIFAHVLTVFLLFTLPQRILGDVARSAFFDYWFQPVATVGSGLTFYGTPILAGLCGLYLAYTETATARSVAGGFLVGGVAFGTAVTLVGWAVTGPLYRQSTAEYVFQFVRFAGLVLAPAVFGALAATAVRSRS